MTTEAPGRIDRPEARWRPVVRLILAIAFGAEASRLVWARVPSKLSLKTDIVGYPIFTGFNSVRYTDGYYVFALVFPLLVACFYLLVAWKGPLRRSATPRTKMFPVTNNDCSAEDLLPVEGESLPAVNAGWSIAKVALVAAAIGLELSVSSARNLRLGTTGSWLGAAAYVGAVAAVGGSWWFMSSRRRTSRHAAGTSSLSAFVSRANALAALVVIPLLYFVSRGTSVSESPTGRILRYPWLPLWLVIVVTIAALWACRRGFVGRRTARDSMELEANVLTWVVGPVILFLLLGGISGPLGAFQAFDDAQYLAAPQLIFHHGLLPWSGIYVLHGLLGDVFDGSVGMALFGNSRWGVASGLSLVVNPLTWICMYAFTAYFCRRNRLVLVGFSIAVATGLLFGNAPRFMLFPLFFILLDRVLRKPGWAICSLFVFALFAGTILTPEEALFVPCLLGTVAVYEWAGRQPGAALASNFRRTWQCFIAGAALTVAWLVYLAATHSVTAFVDYFLVFAQGHGLEGGIPTQWSLSNDLTVTFAWVIGTILWLATIWRVVGKLRVRAAWTIREWVIVAAAMCSAIYFPKALERADVGHVLETFTITVPLLVLWVIEVLDIGDRGVLRILRRLPRIVGSRHFRHVATGGAVIAVLLSALSDLPTVSDVARSIPARFHPTIATSDIPAMHMLGYTVPGTVDTQQIAALGAILDRYAGRNAPVYDYSNELGIVYYLLNRVPGTRFFYPAVIQTKLAQTQAIDNLKASRPPVIIFTNTSFGLLSYDGVPQSLRSPDVSTYLFAHYRPLLDVQGQLLLLRDDLFAKAPPVPAGLTTSGLYFDTPTCNFGDIPNYLTTPTNVLQQQGTPLRLTLVTSDSTTVTGWAIDATTRAASTEILAAVGSHIVAAVPTGVPRPDVAAATHDPAAGTSGFSLFVPSSTTHAVTLYSLNGDGTVSQLAPNGAVPNNLVSRTAVTMLTTPDGITHRVVPDAKTGAVDTAVPQSIRTYQVSPPKGATLAEFSWLRLSTSENLQNNSFQFTDALNAPASHGVDFNVLAAPDRTLDVGVGSCLQWHGYSSFSGIYVTQVGSGQPFSLSLIH